MKIRLLTHDYVQPNSPAGSMFDLPVGQAERLLGMGVAELVVEVSGDPSDAWTVKQLQAYADEHEIDLGAARSKANILAVINTPPDAGKQDDDGSKADEGDDKKE